MRAPASPCQAIAAVFHADREDRSRDRRGDEPPAVGDRTDRKTIGDRQPPRFLSIVGAARDNRVRQRDEHQTIGRDRRPDRLALHEPQLAPDGEVVRDESSALDRKVSPCTAEARLTRQRVVERQRPLLPGGEERNRIGL